MTAKRCLTTKKRRSQKRNERRPVAGLDVQPADGSKFNTAELKTISPCWDGPKYLRMMLSRHRCVSPRAAISNIRGIRHDRNVPAPPLSPQEGNSM